MAKNVLLGVKKFSSKKSGTEKNYEVIVVSGAFNQRAIDNGCFGSDVSEIFLPDNLRGRINPADIGKEIVLDYEVSGNNAYLIGFNVK